LKKLLFHVVAEVIAEVVGEFAACKLAMLP
jgi:hypothetical protein